LEFNCGLTLASFNVNAIIESNGSAALQLSSKTGAGSITIEGGLSGAVGSFIFLDPVTYSVGQLLAQTNPNAETITGANGNLIYNPNANAALVGGTGNDSLYAWGTSDTLTAGSGNQLLYSAYAADKATGGAGNDTLISGMGYDTLIGGTGNTTFVVTTTTDTIQAVNSGTNTNTVDSSVSYTLGANIQDLVLTGTANLTVQPTR